MEKWELVADYIITDFPHRFHEYVNSSSHKLKPTDCGSAIGLVVAQVRIGIAN